MKSNTVNVYFMPAVICSLMVFSATARCDGQYEIPWSTIDGGGGVSIGGPYEVKGTIGQPDAGSSAGGQYEVRGGFWPGGPACFVDFEHYARFAQYWLQTGDEIPADLYGDGQVDWYDVSEFCHWWLYECPYRWPLK